MQAILIQGAMDNEIDYLVSKIANKRIRKIGNIYFYEGNIEYKPVIIEKTGIGIINATIATTVAINNYDPMIIINQGCAGGCSSNLHIGDIVIGEDCININSNRTPCLLENEGSNSLNWKLQNFESENIEKLFANKFTISKLKDNFVYDRKLKYGTIGSGDIWDNEIDRINLLNNKYGVLCEDMETFAVYSTCNQFNIPVIGIRMISNNRLTGEDYNLESLKKLRDFQDTITNILSLI